MFDPNDLREFGINLKPVSTPDDTLMELERAGVSLRPVSQPEPKPSFGMSGGGALLVPGPGWTDSQTPAGQPPVYRAPGVPEERLPGPTADLSEPPRPSMVPNAAGPYGASFTGNFATEQGAQPVRVPEAPPNDLATRDFTEADWNDIHQANAERIAKESAAARFDWMKEHARNFKTEGQKYDAKELSKQYQEAFPGEQFNQNFFDRIAGAYQKAHYLLCSVGSTPERELAKNVDPEDRELVLNAVQDLGSRNQYRGQTSHSGERTVDEYEKHPTGLSQEKKDRPWSRLGESIDSIPGDVSEGAANVGNDFRSMVGRFGETLLRGVERTGHMGEALVNKVADVAGRAKPFSEMTDEEAAFHSKLSDVRQKVDPLERDGALMSVVQSALGMAPDLVGSGAVATQTANLLKDASPWVTKAVSSLAGASLFGANDYKPAEARLIAEGMSKDRASLVALGESAATTLFFTHMPWLDKLAPGTSEAAIKTIGERLSALPKSIGKGVLAMRAAEVVSGELGEVAKKLEGLSDGDFTGVIDNAVDLKRAAKDVAVLALVSGKHLGQELKEGMKFDRVGKNLAETMLAGGDPKSARALSQIENPTQSQVDVAFGGQGPEMTPAARRQFSLGLQDLSYRGVPKGGGPQAGEITAEADRQVYQEDLERRLEDKTGNRGDIANWRKYAQQRGWTPEQYTADLEKTLADDSGAKQPAKPSSLPQDATKPQEAQPTDEAHDGAPGGEYAGQAAKEAIAPVSPEKPKDEPPVVGDTQPSSDTGQLPAEVKLTRDEFASASFDSLGMGQLRDRIKKARGENRKKLQKEYDGLEQVRQASILEKFGPEGQEVSPGAERSIGQQDPAPEQTPPSIGKQPNIPLGTTGPEPGSSNGLTQGDQNVGTSQEVPANSNAKQPWEMTREEFIAHRQKLIDEFRSLSAKNGLEHFDTEAAFNAQSDWGDIDVGHRPAIAKALREGKPVPAEVLAEYPELSKVANQSEGDWKLPEGAYWKGPAGGILAKLPLQVGDVVSADALGSTGVIRKIDGSFAGVGPKGTAYTPTYQVEFNDGGMKGLHPMLGEHLKKVKQGAPSKPEAKPSEKAKSIGGQYAIPGLEDVVQEQVKRETEIHPYRSHLDELDSLAGDGFSSPYKKLVPELERDVLQEAEVNGNAEKALDRFRKSVPTAPEQAWSLGKQRDISDDLARVDNDIIATVTERMSQHLKSAGDFSVGQKVEVEEYRGGMRSLEVGSVESFRIDEDGAIEASVKLKNGKVRQYELKQLENAPEEKPVENDKLKRMLSGEAVTLTKAELDQIDEDYPDHASKIATAMRKEKAGTKDADYVGWIGEEGRPKDLEQRGTEMWARDPRPAEKGASAPEAIPSGEHPDQKLYRETRDAVRGEPETNDYTGTLRGVASVLEQKGVKPVGDVSLTSELSRNFHDPLVSVKDEPIEKVAKMLDQRIATDRKSLPYSDQGILDGKEHGVLSYAYNKAPEKVIQDIEYDRKGGEHSNTIGIADARDTVSTLRRKADIVSALNGETENTAKARALADQLEKSANAREQRLVDLHQKAQQEIRERPVKNAEALQPLKVSKVSIKKGWDKLATDPNGRYLSDTGIILDAKAVPKKDLVALQRTLPEKSNPIPGDKVAEKYWAPMVKGGGEPAKFLGVLGDHAYFSSESGKVYGYDADSTGYIVRLTGPDGVRFGKGFGSGDRLPLVFYKNGEPIALNYRTTDKPSELDVKAAQSKGLSIDGILEPGQKKTLGGKPSRRTSPTMADVVSEGGTNVRQTVSNVPVRPGDMSKAPIAAQDILKTMERVFEVPIHTGRVPGRKEVAGIYRWFPQEIRVKDPFSVELAVGFHEIAHHIDNTTRLIDPRRDTSKTIPGVAQDQMRDMDYAGKGRLSEGWAEFIRHYITEGDTANLAPAADKWFRETFLKDPKNKVLANKIEQARKYATDFKDQSIFQRVRSIIGHPAEDLSFVDRWKKKTSSFMFMLRVGLQDNFHAADILQREAEKRGADFSDRPGPKEYLEHYDRSALPNAQQAAQNGVHSLMDGRILCEPLWKLADYVHNAVEEQEAITYALARHTLFMEQQKPGYTVSSLSRGDAQDFIRYVEQDADKADRYEKYARHIAKFNDATLEMAHEAGAIGDADYARMKNAYQDENYFPLYRTSEHNGDSASSGFFSGGRLVNLSKPVKGRSTYGSDEGILHPVDSTLAKTIHLYGASAKARVGEQIRDVVDKIPGMGFMMVKVAPGKVVHKGNVDEIVDGLVKDGFVDASDAKEWKIAHLLRTDAGVSDKDLAWFAKQKKLDQNSPDFETDLEHALDATPDLMSQVFLWRPNYQPSPKENVAVFHVNGKPVLYQMDPILHRMLTGVDQIHLNGFLRALHSTMGVFKTGAVGLSSGFGAANIIRDWVEYQGKAKAVKGLASAYDPMKQTVNLMRYKFSDILDAMGELAGNQMLKKLGKPYNKVLIDAFDAAGGELYTPLGYDRADHQHLREWKMGRSFGELAVSDPKKLVTTLGGATLRGAQELIAWTDMPPRLAEMEAKLKELGYVPDGDKWKELATGNHVNLPEWALIQGIGAAADATINFKRHGNWVHYMESFMPFSNAAIQATHRQLVQLGTLKNPTSEQAIRFLTSQASLLGATALYWLWRNQDDDYRDAEGWLRDGYWILPGGWRIPKGRDWNILSNTLERLLDARYHNDKQGDWGSMLTRDLIGRGPTMGGVLRAVPEAYGANWDYFRGRAIETAHDMNEPKQERYGPYTSSLSIWIGKMLPGWANTSPKQIDHILSGATGGMYHRLTEVYDAIQEGRLTLSNVPAELAPFVRGLKTSHVQARSISDFYAEWKANSDAVKLNTANGVAPGDVERKKKLQDDAAALMTKIRGVEPKDFRGRRSGDYSKYLTGLARASLGYEPLASSPDPFMDKDLPKELKGIMQDHAERKAKNVILSHGIPQKTAKTEKTYDETFAKWKSRVEADEQWLKVHKDSPYVQEAVRAVMLSKEYSSKLSGKHFPHFPKSGDAETYKHQVDNWSLGLQRAANFSK